ncbi:MAG: glutamate--tRNA ligase [Labilithrix sp.]|nr:glutamate--tRNA ligase [Labilithrix sp.]MCW5834727.1 glutamate--tRNA ligase [Labilithrix sp.]
MTKPRLRFAPSPTGYLHIGGVRTALFNWLWARKTGGTFVLRIEDTDRERSTDASREIILESLRWLGLSWDEGPGVGGAHGPYMQTERLAIYKEHTDRLIASGHAFRCYCTKEELDAQREALKKRDPKAQFKYPGTCRDRRGEPDERHVVRFKAPRDGAVTYVDKVFGEVTTPNVENQDFVIMRSDGVPLYNFGAVVDDVTMGITLVARGRDHMINTPPQILLYQALGAPVPEFAHLPMMLAPNGERLSKRHGAVSVTEYRDKGYAPAAVLNYLARFGWSFGDQEIFSRDELVQAFSWEACGRGDGKFDDKKFLSIDHEHLKSERLLPASDYAESVLPFLAQRGLSGVTKEAVTRALYTVRERARTFVEAADMLDYFFRDAPVMDEKAQKKFLVKDAAARLRGLRDALAGADEWTEAALEARANAHLEAAGLQIKDVAQPARVALTGRSASPGLYQVLFVLGRDASLARLSRGAEIADASASPA